MSDANRPNIPHFSKAQKTVVLESIRDIKKLLDQARALEKVGVDMGDTIKRGETALAQNEALKTTFIDNQ